MALVMMVETEGRVASTNLLPPQEVNPVGHLVVLERVIRLDLFPRRLLYLEPTHEGNHNLKCKIGCMNSRCVRRLSGTCFLLAC